MTPIHTYDDLCKAIASRRKSLGISQIALDDKAGLTANYQGKLEVAMRHFGEMSLECVLGALELEIVVEADPSPLPPAPDVRSVEIVLSAAEAAVIKRIARYRLGLRPLAARIAAAQVDGTAPEQIAEERSHEDRHAAPAETDDVNAGRGWLRSMAVRIRDERLDDEPDTFSLAERASL